MYVERLTVHDFKSFAAKAALDFAHPGRPTTPPADDRPAPLDNVTVLLGDNGAGKTALLRALCLGLLGDLVSSMRLPVSLSVRRVAPPPANAATAERAPTCAAITVDVLGDRAVGEHVDRLAREVTIEDIGGGLEEVREAFSSPATVGRSVPRDWRKQMTEREGPTWFMVAYGANRQIELPDSYDHATRIKQRHPRALRLASLLDPGPFTLVPPTAWLDDSPRRDEVLRLLRAALPEADIGTAGVIEEGDLLFESQGVSLPLAALSDGYRAFIGWVADLLHHLATCAPEGTALDALPGVVLVDEIDLHLHPRWQQEVVDRVARTFPRLQFVLTTHSPLVIGGLRRQNVYRVVRDARGHSRVERPPTEIWGRTPDQLLLDPIFGLDHTRDADFMRVLRRAEADAQRGDGEAARRLNALIAHGGAADEAGEDLPEWVRAAARRRERERAE